MDKFFIYRIFNIQNFKNLNLEIIKEKKTLIKNENFIKKKQKNFSSLRDKFFQLSHKCYSYFSNKFVRENDAFIINPYLPFKEETKLELSLGQFPQLWKKVRPEIQVKFDNLLRTKLTKEFIQETDNYVENVLRSLLFEILPIFYLEGF